ncbi:unannotated protein [freshwater metagenome]|uniref:Unannotated protein n=1 Tax=freshwater metagenome TaxID=449393 RepID=A0A6J6FBT1_9ZZZZ
MQTDRGFVENVQSAHQPGTDLAREADALRLTSGQGAGRPRQGEVVESHVQKEAEPRVDLLHDAFGDDAITIRQHQSGQERSRIGDGHLAHLGDVLVVDGDGQRAGLQAHAGAGETRNQAHVALVLFPAPVALGPFVTPLDPRNDAFERGVELSCPSVTVLELHRDVPGKTVQHDLLRLRRKFAPRLVQVDSVVTRDGLEDALEEPGGRTAPRGDRTLTEGQIGIGDHQFGVHFESGPETVTGLAGTERRIEREVAGRGLLERQTARGTGQVLTERETLVLGALVADDLDRRHTICQPKGRLETVGQATFDSILAHESVDDHVDRVLLVTGQLGVPLQELHDVDDLTVDSGAHETLSGQIVQKGLVLTFTSPHNRGEHLETRPVSERQHPVHDLLRRLPGQPGSVGGAMLSTDARVEQAQVVVHLGDGSHGGTGVATSGLLVDRDGGRQTLDHVHVGFVHLAEELARVGAQGLDVPTLPFGVDRVEGQRRLPAPRETGEHDHLVARQIDADVLQIVLASTTNHQTIGHDRRLPIALHRLSTGIAHLPS